MTVEEKIDRIFEIQYMCIHQLNSIVDYISKSDNIPVETHIDKVGDGDDT